MIFRDANIFLRQLVRSTRPETDRMQAIASNLFDAIESGELEATTSEVVLHEVCYVLAFKRRYHLAPGEIASYLVPLLRIAGLKLGRGEKRLFRRALELYVANPKLVFADSIIAARSEANGIGLATFDEALARIPSVTRWQPQN